MRHVHFCEDQLWGQHCDIAKRLISIGCGANEIKIAGFFQDLREGFQHEWRIIYHERPDPGLGYILDLFSCAVHDHGLFSPMKKCALFSQARNSSSRLSAEGRAESTYCTAHDGEQSRIGPSSLRWILQKQRSAIGS